MNHDAFFQWIVPEINSVLPCATKDVQRFIACQFALESGWSESAIAKENFNLGGMRCAAIRPTCHIGVNRAHATFSNYHFFIIDYALWLAYNKFSQRELGDLQAFKEHLIRANYCSNEKYISSIEKIYFQHFNS